MKLKPWYCNECGAEVDLHYITLTKIFTINEKGKLERDDNNDAIMNGPYVDFFCSEDLEHKIKETKKFDDWAEKIESEFYELKCYDL